MNVITLCRVDDVAPGTVRRIEPDALGPLRARFPEGLALVRIGDDWFALVDRCSHEKVRLSEGEVYADTCEIECWKHGSTFSLRTGEPSTLPATQPVAVVTVTVRDGEVVAEVPS